MNHIFSRCLFALALPTLIAAATVPRISSEELVAQSEIIVQATVGRSWTAWDSKHKYIWTHYELSITDPIRKTGRAAPLVVSEPGGSLDGIHQQISGTVPYTQGETAILFLYRTPIGYWRAVGGPQGKFTVSADGRMHASTAGVAYAEPVGAVAPGTPLTAFEGLALPDFKLRVRRLAAAHPFQVTK